MAADKLFLTYEETQQAIVYIRQIVNPKIDITDGDAVATALNDMGALHAYSATVLASADYHSKIDKKDPVKLSVKLLAERLNNSIGSRMRAYITLLSNLKEEKKNTMR